MNFFNVLQQTRRNYREKREPHIEDIINLFLAEIRLTLEDRMISAENEGKWHTTYIKKFDDNNYKGLDKREQTIVEKELGKYLKKKHSKKIKFVPILIYTPYHTSLHLGGFYTLIITWLLDK